VVALKGISKNIQLTFSPCNGEIRVRLKKDVFRDTLKFKISDVRVYLP
jgi:hypothetical protein